MSSPNDYRRSKAENQLGRPVTVDEARADGRVAFGEKLRGWRLARPRAAGLVDAAVQIGLDPDRLDAIERGELPAVTDRESALISRWRRSAPRQLDVIEHEAVMRWHRERGDPRRTGDRRRSR